MYMLYVWLAVFVIGLLVELITEGSLVSVWFSVGAIIPFFISLSRSNSAGIIVTQVVVFGVVTTVCLFSLRKVFKRMLFKNSQEKTNLDVHIGKVLKVISVNEEGDKAMVKLNDVEYFAIAEKEGVVFEPKQEVEVVKFKGNKVVVKIINKGEK